MKLVTGQWRFGRSFRIVFIEEGPSLPFMFLIAGNALDALPEDEEFLE